MQQGGQILSPLNYMFTHLVQLNFREKKLLIFIIFLDTIWILIYNYYNSILITSTVSAQIKLYKLILL